MENRKIKILAIDDNNDNLISLKALIKEAFPEALTFTAQNGKRGLELAAAEDPDVILLDVVMPEMDGFEVCLKLKENQKLRDIPVVFITALKGDKESRIRALNSGGDAFLSKPIDESELTAQIRAMVKIKIANLEKRDEKEQLATLIEEQTGELRKTHVATLNLLEDLSRENEARKKSELALRESEERFRHTFDYSANSVCIIGIDGKFQHVNNSFVNLFGYSDEEIKNYHFNQITYPDDISIGSKLFEKMIEGNLKNTSFEKRYLTREKNIIWSHVSTSLVRDNSNNPQFFITQIIDITDRKKAEKELLEQMEEITKFNRLTVGREEKMIELKNEINMLLEKEGKPKKYNVIFD